MVLEQINLDKYEHIDLSMEQPGGLSHKHMGIGVAPTLDRGSTLGVEPHEGSSTEPRWGIHPCQESSLFPSPRENELKITSMQLESVRGMVHGIHVFFYLQFL